MFISRHRLILFLLSLASFGAIGAALVAQHRFGMEPCPWCILQRLLFGVIGVLAMVAAILPSGLGRRLLAALIVPIAGAGVAAALWQHYVAANATACTLTLADRVITTLQLDQHWPDVFQVRASCADAVAHILGVPFEFWSLALFALLGVLALTCAFMRGRRHR